MFKRVFTGLLSFFGEKKRLYRAQLVEDTPERLQDWTVYLQNHLEHTWQASMVCPCGCKQILHMNLLSEYNPHWKFTVHSDKSVSLSPSIDRLVGCKSHFFLRKGRIEWCKR